MKTLDENLEDYWNTAFEEGVTGAETDEGAAQAARHGIQTEFRTLKARVAELEAQKSEAAVVLMAGDGTEETRLAALKIIDQP